MAAASKRTVLSEIAQGGLKPELLVKALEEAGQDEALFEHVRQQIITGIHARVARIMEFVGANTLTQQAKDAYQERIDAYRRLLTDIENCADVTIPGDLSSVVLPGHASRNTAEIRDGVSEK